MSTPLAEPTTGFMIAEVTVTVTYNLSVKVPRPPLEELVSDGWGGLTIHDWTDPYKVRVAHEDWLQNLIHDLENYGPVIWHTDCVSNFDVVSNTCDDVTVEVNSVTL